MATADVLSSLKHQQVLLEMMNLLNSFKQRQKIHHCSALLVRVEGPSAGGRMRSLFPLEQILSLLSAELMKQQEKRLSFSSLPLENTTKPSSPRAGISFRPLLGDRRRISEKRLRQISAVLRSWSHLSAPKPPRGPICLLY